MLLIFHHIAKTAGTSLRLMLKHNYQTDELWELYGPQRDSVTWYREFYQQLTPEQKANMRCVAAHTAHFIIPVLDQPFKVFCLLRDPVDRMISLYHFVLSIAETEQGRGGQTGRMIRELGWQLPDIYLNLGDGKATDSNLHELFKHFFNGQTRTLLAPHTDSDQIAFNAQILPTTQQAMLDELLQQHYIVGVQEYYQASIHYFAEQFHWQQVTHLMENVSQQRPAPHMLPKEVEQLIRTHNQLDTQLHQHYLQQFC